MSGCQVSSLRSPMTGTPASLSARATSPSSALYAIGSCPRLSKPSARSRTYNSVPARLASVLLVISILKSLLDFCLRQIVSAPGPGEGHDRDNESPADSDRHRPAARRKPHSTEAH